MGDDAPVFYTAFGLSLRSSQTIPGLTPSDHRSSSPDIDIHLASQPVVLEPTTESRDELYYISPETDERGEPAFRIWRTADKALLRMDYFDGVRFWLRRDGTAVWCTWPADFTVRDAAVYLLGPILGVLLRLRGVTCLHASAVVLGDQVVAFAGPPGAGKSTTATALGCRGHAIISDDIVAIEERDGEFFVFPAHPYVCLWPESVEMLYGKQKSIPGFAATWDKGRMSLAEHDLRFQEQPVRLGAVCLLGERASAGASVAEPRSPRESFVGLIADSYGTNLLEQEMRVKEFELLSRLVRRVPIWALHAGDGKLQELCTFIEGKFAPGLSLEAGAR